MLILPLNDGNNRRRRENEDICLWVCVHTMYVFIGVRVCVCFMCVNLISAVFFCSTTIGSLLLSLVCTPLLNPSAVAVQRVPPPSPFIGFISSANASLPSADLLYAPSAAPLCIPFAVLLKTGTEVNQSIPRPLFLPGCSQRPGSACGSISASPSSASPS